MAGCARPAPERKLTERERDSILATQPLPGAGAVGGALKASDRAAAHAAEAGAALDSLER